MEALHQDLQIVPPTNVRRSITVETVMPRTTRTGATNMHVEMMPVTFLHQ
jgi:hypothetical protein